MCRPPHNVGRSSSRVRRRACGLPYPASGRRSLPSVVLHVCFLTGVPQRRRPSRCPPFHAPIPPATSTIVQPRPTGVRWFPGRAPPVPSLGRFGRATARCVDHPQASMGSRYRPGTAPGPAGYPPSCPACDPTPITQVKVCTRAKSRVSIETRELRLSSR